MCSSRNESIADGKFARCRRRSVSISAIETSRMFDSNALTLDKCAGYRLTPEILLRRGNVRPASPAVDWCDAGLRYINPSTDEIRCAAQRPDESVQTTT